MKRMSNDNDKRKKAQAKKVPATFVIKEQRSFISKVAGTFLAASLFLGTSAFAQGLTVPAGSSLDVNTGTLRVAGNITVAGTLETSTGAVSLTGNWDNSAGTYTPGTGTLEFNGTAVTQTLISGGIGAGNLFYDVTHSGSGTVTLSTDAVNIDNNFTNSAGTWDVSALGCTGGTASCGMTVAGGWDNDGTFTGRTGTVTLDGTDQSVDGSTTFYSITKTLAAGPSRTITFDNAGTQTITNTLTLQGFDASNRLLLRSDSTPNQWEVSLQAGGLQSMQYLDVMDSNAAGGLLLIAGTGSVGASQNNTNWSFAGATMTWQGDVSAVWNNPSNWDLGVVPGSADTAIIPDVTGGGDLQPIVNLNLTGADALTDLTIQSGATMDLDTFDLTVSDELDNEGTLILSGGQTVSIDKIDVDSGTFRFVGDEDGSSGEVFSVANLGVTGTTGFYSVEINSTVNPDVFRTSADLNILGNLTVTGSSLDISTNANTATVAGNLVVNGGTLTATLGDLDVNGNASISSGTLTAPNGSNTFNLAGNFTNTGGTYTHSSGTLTLDGSSQSILGTSGTTFYGLVKNVTSAATLTFTSSATTTIAAGGNLDLQGVVGNVLTITTDSSPTVAALTLTASATQTLNYLSVEYNTGAGGVTLVARNSSELTAASTTNWVFGAATLTWEGDVVGSETDWEVPGNWDLGIVPTELDTAIIANVVNDPTLTANARVENLTINAGGVTVTLATFNLTVDDTLSNSGTVSLQGSETVSIATPDTDSGDFIFTGTGAGATLTISDIGANDFYNVTFNDGGGSPDTFRITSDLTVLNDITLTSGTLDISTNTNTLTVTNDLTVGGGTLTATNGNIDVNHDVILSSGTLTAPASGQSFTIAEDFDRSGGGTLGIAGNGTVTFDSTNTSVINGSTTFYDLTSSIAGKTITFTGLTTQTVNGTLTVTGNATTEIVLASSNPTVDIWTIDAANASQSVQFANVSDSNADTNDIVCFSCTNAGGNDNAAASPHWSFLVLAISEPQSGDTVDGTPTILGSADPAQTVDIRDGPLVTDTLLGTVVTDANGNFRFEAIEANALAVGSRQIVPFIGVLGGGAIPVTVVATPTAAQQPRISLPKDGARVHGSKPTISGEGLAGATVTVRAADANGNLLLAAVASTTIAGDGTYSVTLTTDLFKGTNYVSVSVSDVGSDIFEISLTDPFGVVFDSVSNQPIDNATVSLFRSVDDQLAVPGVDIDSNDVNPVTTGNDGFYSFLTANADYYITVSAEGYDYPSALDSFPVARTIVTGSKGEVFTVAGVIIEMDHPVDSNGQLLRIEKSANKSKAHVGDVVTYTINIDNQTSTNVIDAFIKDRIPPGFKYISDRVTIDGVPVVDPSGDRDLDFKMNVIYPGITKILKYQLVVGAGVTEGRYENSAVAHYDTGQLISNNTTEAVDIVADPLFDLGTVIGKVYFDRNENGLQDEPEYSPLEKEVLREGPVPNVRIAMEDGTLITTDQKGRFSVPALTPGRHLFRLDERTLPEGSYLTTNKVVIVDITKGLTAKVNFGVNVDYDISQDKNLQFFTEDVSVVQEDKRPKPRLHTSLFNEELVLYEDVPVEALEFKVFTNYASFIEYWKLEIVDRDTNRLIRKFDGNRLNIHDPILWDGRDATGEYVRTDRNYQYLLYVEDAKGKWDETKPQLLNFREIEEKEEYEEFIEATDARREKYPQWAKGQSTVNSVRLQNIFVEGETVFIDRNQTNLKSIRVIKDGQLFVDVPVTKAKALTARELIDGDLRQATDDLNKVDVILPKGDYILQVQQIPDGDEEGLVYDEGGLAALTDVSSLTSDTRKYSTFNRPLKIGEDRVFFVAMGDAKMGYTFTRGNIEVVEQDEKFTNGFWSEGQLAYYLKGKVLGKYLITSSFDSNRKRKELFRNLDPDEYYPVYGDDGNIDYDATNTQGNLFVLVEWDKSEAKWGNYSIGFDETEFSQYSRSLFGGMVDFESLSATKFGDSRTKVVAFHARTQQKSAHNEFLATGGSLYFLKHKDVIEGSDKVLIEVRDKITGLVVSSREMKEGADYEMDYNSGRILFWRPVPILVDTYSIISNDLLDGNLVYVITDYQYEVNEKLDESTAGTRVRQALSDNVIAGVTYVSETQDQTDYELRGTDVTVRLSEDASVTAEYAETVSESQGTFISTDGGLSFAELKTSEISSGSAYGIKGDARLFNRLGVSSYYKWIGNDFSSAATTSQQGKELSGFEVVYDLAEKTRLSARHDIQSLIHDGNAQTQLQLGAFKTSTSIVQVVHEIRDLKLTGEYQRQVTKSRIDKFDSQSEEIEDSLAIRGDYTVSDKLELSIEQQMTIHGAKNNQTTLGAIVKPTESITIEAKEVIATSGTATELDVTADVSERLSLTGGYAITTDKAGNVEKTSTMGAEAKISDEVEVRTSVTTDKAGQRTTTLGVGASKQVDEKTSVNTNIEMAKSVDDSSTTLSFGGDSQINDKTTTTSQFDLTDSKTEGRSSAMSFGSSSRLTQDLRVATNRAFGQTPEANTTDSTYSLIREKNGKKLEGSLTRAYSEGDKDITSSNIYGLSGDIDDRWAFSGSYERGEVQSHDGSESDRDVVSLGMGYSHTDEETGKALSSSTKLEARFDDGEENKRQYLVFSSVEGKLSSELTVFSKIEISKTRNETAGRYEAKHKELIIGAAYRPIYHDRLNILSRYTYLEERSPEGQEDKSDIEEESAHVMAVDVIYDLTDKWQVTEKFAYRIGEEKVTGFDFTKTHTWLMIHRLNYKIDSDWTIGSEFRILDVEEARDQKRGFLIEGARRVGEFAQIGIGYNFTEFDDDLTHLDYASEGPFMRITGSLYDQTQEEKDRNKQRWLQEKIAYWAWIMVDDELSRDDSPILYELNSYFVLAQKAHKDGRLEESQQIYRDIIMAGQMMFAEAAQYIQGQIDKEEKLKEMSTLADQYYKNGQYDKAKKILEKILEEVQGPMVE